MGLGDWWRRLRQKEDAETVERALERQDETPEERRVTSSDREGLGADEVAARETHEATIEDADRLGEGD